MISKAGFENLILTGSALVKTYIQMDKIQEQVNDLDDTIENKVIENLALIILDTINSATLFDGVVNFIANSYECIGSPKAFERDFSNILISQCISLYAFENEYADNYRDLVYSAYEYGEIPDELKEFEEMILKNSREELHYVRTHF